MPKMTFARGLLSDGTALQVQVTSDLLTQDELSEYVRMVMEAARRCCSELKERRRLILSLELGAATELLVPRCACGAPIVEIGAGTCGEATCLNKAIARELETLKPEGHQ